MLQTETSIGEILYEEGFEIVQLEGKIELDGDWVRVSSPDPDVEGCTLIRSSRVVKIELH